MSPSFPSRPSVTLTQADYDTAKRADSTHCLIADGLRRTYPDARNIIVDARTVRMSDPKSRKRFTWLTPLKAARVLVQWDQGMDPDPTRIGFGSPIQIQPMRPPGTGYAKASITKKGKVIGGRSVPLGEIAGKPKPVGASTKQTTAASLRARTFGLRQLSIPILSDGTPVPMPSSHVIEFDDPRDSEE